MTHTITLELDELDWNAVQKAMAIRQRSRIWPDAPEGPDAGQSNVAGLCIAEICRGWIEMLQIRGSLPPE